MPVPETALISRSRTRLLGRLQRRKTREREGLYLVEGIRCATTVLDAGIPVRFAVVSKDELASTREVRERLPEGTEVIEVAASTLRELSDTRTPQGVLLVCSEPEAGLDGLDVESGDRLLVLDAIQDPGNLGTLVRTAAGFGLGAVITLDGTVDPYNPKAVRASAGAVALIPVVAATMPTLRPLLASASLPLLAATGDGVDVATIPVSSGWALAVGNEGAGLRPELLDLADRRVAIPIAERMDSLNAGLAGAILMYALSQRPQQRSLE